MRFLDIVAPLEVGNRAGDFKEACDGPEREAETPYHLIDDLLRFDSEDAMTGYLFVA